MQCTNFGLYTKQHNPEKATIGGIISPSISSNQSNHTQPNFASFIKVHPIGSLPNPLTLILCFYSLVFLQPTSRSRASALAGRKISRAGSTTAGLGLISALLTPKITKTNHGRATAASTQW